MTIRRVKAVLRSPKAPVLSPDGGGDALVSHISTGCHHQGDRPALSVSGEDIDADATGGVHHELFLGAVCPSPRRTETQNSLQHQFRNLLVDRINVVELRKWVIDQIHQVAIHQWYRLTFRWDAQQINVANLRLLTTDVTNYLNPITTRLKLPFQLLSYCPGFLQLHVNPF